MRPAAAFTWPDPPFLRILACPGCHQPLAWKRGEHPRLSCAGGHVHLITELGIPLFGRSAGEATGERKQRQEEATAAYAALRAFAVETLGSGAAEGLYRTVSDLLLRSLAVSRPRWLLDVGCGPGRTLVDAATGFPGSRVVGVEASLGALTVAYAITSLRGQAAEADLRRWGFGTRIIEGRALKNVRLAQADAERLPFQPDRRWQGFDAVTCVNLIDRAKDPDAVLDEIARVTRPGGHLILATPLNWRVPGGRYWDALDDIDALKRAVEKRGFESGLAFDHLVYREIIDPRGSLTDWQVAVISARRAAA